MSIKTSRQIIISVCLLALLWLWPAAAPTYADGPIFKDNGQQFLDSLTNKGVALGDLDGDGDLDAFVSNGNGQANRVWLNYSPSPVTLTKTSQASFVAPGETMTYTISVENNRILTTTRLLITDTLPAGLSPGGVKTWGPLDLAPKSTWTTLFTAVVAGDFEGR